MKSQAIDRTTAEAIVRAWLDDVPCPAATGGPLRVRVWLDEHNKLASNAMWDGKPNTAYMLLLKHGALDKRRKIDLPNSSFEKNRLGAARLALANYVEAGRSIGRGPTARTRKRASWP